MTKTILITGSSSGIGKATAKHFAAQGWNVVATMRKPEAETELGALDNVLVTRLDVHGRRVHRERRWPTACAESGSTTIDVLLNNAGLRCVRSCSKRSPWATRSAGSSTRTSSGLLAR